jgi:hypothetical protein
MRTSIQCPKTTETITINLSDDRGEVPRCWNRSFKVSCPYCKDVHVARYRDLYVDGVLLGFQGDFNALLEMSAKGS